MLRKQERDEGREEQALQVLKNIEADLRDLIVTFERFVNVMGRIAEAHEARSNDDPGPIGTEWQGRRRRPDAV